MNLSDISLTLFFTAGVGLDTWSSVGNLNRELALYTSLSSQLKKIQFLTYDPLDHQKYQEQIAPIQILPSAWYPYSPMTLGNILYRYHSQLKKTDILKTNQILGSEIAINSKRIFRKPLIVRCGYLHSFFTQQSTNNLQIIKRAIQLEKNAFVNADIGIVTTSEQRDFVIRTHSINEDKIIVIPNYVVTDIFRPHIQEKKWDLIYIGRSDIQKNLVALLDAISQVQSKHFFLSLLIIGGASQDSELQSIVQNLKINVTFLSNVDNNSLPFFLNSSRIFILPSLYEGHPKTLLEAMSCGLPCIGTPVRGIQEEIVHGKTGFLSSNTSSKALADAITTVLNDEELREKIGKNAREYICSRYSLEKIVDMECHCIEDVMNRW